MSLHLFAIRRLKADVDDVRAILHLPTRDLARLFPFLGRDHFLEQARADDVGALAHDQGTIRVFGFDQFDAGIVRLVGRRLEPREACALRPSARSLGYARAWCRSIRRRCSASRVRQISTVARPTTPASPDTCLLRSAIRRSDNTTRAWSTSPRMVRMWSVIRSGPVAQFSPIESRSACATDAYNASAGCPASIAPKRSMVPEIISGIRSPISVSRRFIAAIAALILRVSNAVSINRISAPPSISAFAWRIVALAQLGEGYVTAQSDRFGGRPH